MAQPPTRRCALVAVAAVFAILAPATTASAATINIKAPDKIDHTEKFRVIAKGKAKVNRKYRVAVVYHDDDQGRCESTFIREIGQNNDVVLFNQLITTDKDGEFKVTSRKIFGGRVTSGKFCGYLSQRNALPKDNAVHRIKFT